MNITHFKKNRGNSSRLQQTLIWPQILSAFLKDKKKFKVDEKAFYKVKRKSSCIVFTFATKMQNLVKVAKDFGF